jgi:rare lipoprotein A
MVCSSHTPLPYKKGTATFYSKRFEGRKTASGIKFRNDSMYAAHKSLKFGTRVKIFTNKDTVIVTIVDRGQLYGRTFDLSQKAFKQLHPLKRGVVKIKYQILK